MPNLNDYSAGNLRRLASLSPEEQASSDAFERDPSNTDALRAEIARTRDIKARAVLLEELQRRVGVGDVVAPGRLEIAAARAAPADLFAAYDAKFGGKSGPVAAAAAGGDDPFAAYDAKYGSKTEPKESTGFWRSAGDLAIKGSQGVVDVGQSAVGLASLATGGLIGHAMRSAGYDPEATNKAMGEFLSPAQKEAEANVQAADGFVDSLIALARNPRAISGSIAESLPGVFAMGGAQAKAAQMIATKAAAQFGGLATEAGAAAAKQAVNDAAGRLMWVGAGAEGAQTAGQQADQAQALGREFSQYALPSVAAGVGTALIGRGAGKLMGDAETALFTGAKSAGISGNLPTRVAKSIFSEGFLEEMPQSAQEQVWQNIGQGKPWDEGVANQAAMGLVTGGAMGGGMGMLQGHKGEQAKPTAADVLAAPDIDGAILQAKAATSAPVAPALELAPLSAPDGIPFDVDPVLSSLAPGGKKGLFPAFRNKQAADIYIGNQALLGAYDAVQTEPGRWEIQPTAATAAALLRSDKLPVGEATEELPAGDARELTDAERQAYVERRRFSDQRMIERGIPVPDAGEAIPAGDAMEVQPIPADYATEEIPAGEAAEVLPVGETSELISTGDASEVPKRIRAGVATELPVETIQADDLLTDAGVPYGGRTTANLRARREGLPLGHVVEIPNAGFVERPALDVRPNNTRGTTAADVIKGATTNAVQPLNEAARPTPEAARGQAPAAAAEPAPAPAVVPRAGSADVVEADGMKAAATQQPGNAAPPAPPQAADYQSGAAYHAALTEYRKANPVTPAGNAATQQGNAVTPRDRRAEIKRELAALNAQYLKRMNRADPAAPPAIKADALAGIARKMDKLDAELKALDAKDAAAPVEAGSGGAAPAPAAAAPGAPEVLADYPSLKPADVQRANVERQAPATPETAAARRERMKAALASGATKEAAPVAPLQDAYNAAKARLDELGPEPRHPSPEARHFGARGRAGAEPDAVARYDAAVREYSAWKRKYTKLKKAEVDASNALFHARNAAATHKDPGEPPEQATQAIVAESIAKAAKRENRKPSEMLAELLGKIDEAIAAAQSEPVRPLSLPADRKYITFDIAGDGKFKVLNNRANLMAFRQEAERSRGFKDTKTPKPAMGRAGGSELGPDSLAREMLDDGEPLNALEVMDAAGRPMLFGNAPKRPIPYTSTEPVELAGISGFFVGRGWSLGAGGDKRSWWRVIHRESGFPIGGERGTKADAMAAAKKALADNREKFDSAVAAGKSLDGQPFKGQDQLRAEFAEWAQAHQLSTFAAADAAAERAAKQKAKEGKSDAFYREIMGENRKRPARDDWTKAAVDGFLAAAEKAGKAEEAIAFVDDGSVANEFADRVAKEWEAAYRRRTKATDAYAGKPATPAEASKPAEQPATTGIASQTFDQWARAQYAGNEYKTSYLEAFNGNENRAVLASIVGNIDETATTAKLLQAAKQEYRSKLFSLPRESTISFAVYDELTPDQQNEAIRHFYDLDSRITRRTQDDTKARVQAVAAKKASYEAVFAEVDAEIRRLDKIHGPETQKQKDLSARRERLRHAIYQIGQGKEPDGRLLRAEQPSAPPQAAENAAPAAEQPTPEPASPPPEGFAAKTLNELRAEAGTKGIWLGILHRNDGETFDVKVIPWPNPNMGAWGFEFWKDGKSGDRIPFPRITGNDTAQSLADTIVDYLMADKDGQTFSMALGAKHGGLVAQRSTVEQRKADAEMAAMRKFRGDTEARPWDAVDLENKRKYDAIAERRYKTAADETMLKLLDARIKADPRKWHAGDGVGYHVHRQINRGFQVVSVDEANKTAEIAQVADTGLTATGGNGDRIGRQIVDIADLVRDRKYDRPAAAVAAAPTPAQQAERMVPAAAPESEAAKSTPDLQTPPAQQAAAILSAAAEPPTGKERLEVLKDVKSGAVTPEEVAAAYPAANDGAPEVVTHITAKGKELRGVIRTDLSKEEAQAIDKYTFRKGGGWFIREDRLSEAPAANTDVAASESSAPAETATQDAAAKDQAKRAEKAASLREAGQKLIDGAEEDRGRERLANTPKRVGQAASAEVEAMRREHIGKKMLRLADAIEDGEAVALAGVTTRTQVELIESISQEAMGARDRAESLSYVDQQRRRGRPLEPADLNHVKYPGYERWLDGAKNNLLEELKGKRGAGQLAGEIRSAHTVTPAILSAARSFVPADRLRSIVGWYAVDSAADSQRLQRAGIADKQALREAVREYDGLKAERAQDDPLKAAERALVGQKVGIDFFPTPKPVAEQMAQAAGIEPGMRVLEPSAGNGNLADAARAAGATVDVVEISDTLRDILQAKGHQIVGRDFDEFEPAEQYDVVLMNPPFSKRADANHIRRAFGMLKPGGRLVAIAGEGVFGGSDKAATEFRSWLDESGATIEPLPANTFKGADLPAQTSANARMVVIDKPGAEEASGTRFSRGEPAGPAITEQAARAAINDAFGAKLGRALLDGGMIELVTGRDFNGATLSNGTVLLNLDSLTAETFGGALRHEAFHSAVREWIGEDAYGALMARMEALRARAGDRPDSWFARAAAAIPADTLPWQMNEELAAYAIEQARDAPGPIRQWVNNLLSALRTAIIRHMPAGKIRAWAVLNIKPEDLSRMAVAAMRARGEALRGEQSAVAFSRGDQTDPDGADIRYSRTTSASATAPSLAARLRNAGGGPKIVGNTGRYTPELLRSMERVGRTVEQPTLEARAKAIWKDAGKKMAQGLFDQFAPVKDISEKGYMLLRLSKSASGAFETVLQGGKLRLDGDDAYDFDKNNRGGLVDTLLKPLGGEHHDFFWWVAANRAERLANEWKVTMPDGTVQTVDGQARADAVVVANPGSTAEAASRERLFEPEDIAAHKTLADGTTDFDYTVQHGASAGQITRDRALIYRDSLITFNGFNKNMLDMAQQSGGIDADWRAKFEQEFYLPFYRVDEDSESGGIMGASLTGGAVRQEFIKALKGGKEKLNADLLDNTLMNWAHLLDAAAKNRAAKTTLAAAEDMGAAISTTETAAREMAASMGKKSHVVWVMDEGKKHFYVVDDPMLLIALTSLQYAGMKGPIMDAMGSFKHALTIGVTASPFFKVRNLIRDSLQSIGSAPFGYNPAANVAQGWALTHPRSDAYFSLLAGGGTIHFGTMLEGNEAKRVQALVESGVPRATILDGDHKFKAFYRQWIEPSITAYNELGNRGEAINRAALYAQLKAQGMSHAQASLQARDLMDFSMQGSFTSIRFLAQVVPFFNARLQGLYKLGRAAKEDPARFATVIGAASVASIALVMAFSDDDDWKKREDWDRNNFWWFKFGGTAFRIPKPFEIGAIATLAERGFELAFDKEMTGKRFRNNVLALLGDNLSMNPIPQMVKPLMDVYANKDSFTGRPIETMGMERLQSQYRFTSNTSMAARGISTAANSVTGLIGKPALSPVEVDHLLRGYFGWLGAFVVGASDILLRPATGEPTKPDADFFKAATGGMVADLRDAPSRYVTQMYEQAKAIEAAYATWKHLVAQGKAEDAGEFFADNRELIGKHRIATGLKKAEGDATAQMRRIEISNMTGAEKRERIREILQRKDRIARPLADVN